MTTIRVLLVFLVLLISAIRIYVEASNRGRFEVKSGSESLSDKIKVLEKEDPVLASRINIIIKIQVVLAIAMFVSFYYK